MKDIQEIMLKMEILGEQIATTLNEEEKINDEQPTSKELMARVEEIKEPADLVSDDAVVAAIPPCAANCPANRRVDFCCILDVPGNLGIIPADFVRMIFSTDCLRCVVEPCSSTTTVCGCPFNLTLYNVKIVGCIPFLINHAVNSTECFSSPLFLSDLCCHDSVCVDNVICTKCNEADANAACDIIRGKLASCRCTTVTFNPVTNINCNGVLKGLQVSGFFTLPNCNPPQLLNCNPA